MQATVFSFDTETSEGSVVLDDGQILTFGADAFRRGGLRLLRPGQRVRLNLSDREDVVAVTLSTFPDPLGEDVH